MNTPPKFWNVVADERSDTAEIVLYGDIVSQQPVDFWTGQAIEGNYITPEGFLDDLSKCKGKNNLIIRLNSCGGDLFTGIAIHNALKGFNGKKTVIVEGIAASAASVIACAGDEVQVYPGSITMIHGVSTFVFDALNLSDMKKMVKAMDSMENAIAAIYSAKTGKEVGELRNLITRETWMTGQEAIDNGFADTLIDGEVANKLQLVASASGKFVLQAGGHVLSSDFRAAIPDRFHVSVINSVRSEQTAEGDSSEDDLQEKLLQAEQELAAAKSELAALQEKMATSQEPDAKAKEEIIAQAIAEERKRLSDIEAIANGIDPELVQDAKFGETPMTAQELAFRAMSSGKFSGASFLNSRAADLQDSNTGRVTIAPTGNEAGGNYTSRLAEAIKAANESTKPKK